VPDLKKIKPGAPVSAKWDPIRKQIVIDPASVHLDQYPFNVEDLTSVAAQLRATGKATLKLRRSGPLAGLGLSLAVHELAHLTGMNVFFIKNGKSQVEIGARPFVTHQVS
jgi:hypothetical protein